MVAQNTGQRQYHRPSILFPIVARCFKPLPPKKADRARETIQPLEKRRAAAKRLPPLECGCRDPWVHVCGRHQ